MPNPEKQSTEVINKPTNVNPTNVKSTTGEHEIGKNVVNEHYTLTIKASLDNANSIQYTYVLTNDTTKDSTADIDAIKKILANMKEADQITVDSNLDALNKDENKKKEAQEYAARKMRDLRVNYCKCSTKNITNNVPSPPRPSSAKPIPIQPFGERSSLKMNVNPDQKYPVNVENFNTEFTKKLKGVGIQGEISPDKKTVTADDISVTHKTGANGNITQQTFSCGKGDQNKKAFSALIAAHRETNKDIALHCTDNAATLMEDDGIIMEPPKNKGDKPISRLDKKLELLGSPNNIKISDKTIRDLANYSSEAGKAVLKAIEEHNKKIDETKINLDVPRTGPGR
jgi:hypothetical protein